MLSIWRTVSYAFSLGLYAASHLYGSPSGFALRSGDACVDELSTYVRSSENSWIDWESFSLALSEKIHFEQADAGHYILNRVVGDDLSSIFGTLSSNGAVYLVNANGILIGPDASIETAGFIASTLDLVRGGEEVFGKRSDAGVIHQGKIHCPVGDIYLIGHRVENEGVLSAPQGKVILQSESDILVCPKNAPQVMVRTNDVIDEELLQENPYAFAIQHRGAIRAREVSLRSAEVVLADESTIDVSSERGGGAVSVKGDRIRIDEEARILANGLQDSSGGRVVLVAEEAAIYRGLIEIRGGDLGGDGGFAEVSGRYLDFRGHVDGASLGAPGSVLLDPTDITISSNPSTSGSFIANNWVSTATPSNIDVSSLTGLLNASNNVTVNTASAFLGTGNLIVADAIVWTTAQTLTLTANATLTINAIVNNSAAGTLALTGSLVDINASITGNNVSVTGALDIANGAHMILTGAFSQSGGAVSTGANIITVDDNISFAGPVTLTANVLLSAGGVGNVSLGSTVDGGFALTVEGTDITFTGALGSSTPLTSLQVSALDTISVGGDQTVSSGPMSYIGDVVLTSDVDFTDGGASGVSFQTNTAKAISGNFDATILAINTGVTVVGEIDLTAAASAGGSLTVTAGDDLSFQGAISTIGKGSGSAGGAITITSSGGSIALNALNASGGSGVAAGDGAAILLRPASGYSGGFPIGKIVLSGDLTSLKGTGAGGNDGTITLSANRSASSTVATITSSLAGNDVAISCGSFTMGAYEAMTILGDLTCSATSTLVLGDIVVLGNLSLQATQFISLLVHGDETILASTGELYTSPSLHWLSGGTYSQSGTLVPSGPLDARSLNLSSDVFRSLLIFGGSTILNYDTTLPIPLSPLLAIYELCVVDAQLSDLLPIFDPLCPPIDRHKTGMGCMKFIREQASPKRKQYVISL